MHLMTETNLNCKYIYWVPTANETFPLGCKSQLNNKEITADSFEIHIKHKSYLSAERKISLVLNLVIH